MARPARGQELHATAFVGVRLPEQLREAIERIAAENNVSLTEQVRTALEEYVSRHDRKPRKSG